MYPIKLILYFIAISLCSFVASGQAFYEPEGGTPSISYVKIEKVELTDSFSIFYMRYEYNGNKERWLCANDGYYIREEDNNREVKKHLIKSEQLPWCPEKHYLQTGETLHFKLYFPPLSSDKVILTFIEGTESFNTSSNFNYYFNFYGFQLKPLPSPGSTNKSLDHSEVIYHNKVIGLKDSIHLNILFEHGQDKLIENTVKELDHLYDFLKVHPSIKIELQGHTESDQKNFTKNQRKLNYTLSEKRVKR